MTSTSTYFLLAFVAIIFISFQTSAKPQCGENKTLSDVGTHCPDCFNAICVRCGLQNVTDCYCKEGYMILGNGSDNCVKTEDCPVCPSCPCALNRGKSHC